MYEDEVTEGLRLAAMRNKREQANLKAKDNRRSGISGKKGSQDEELSGRIKDPSKKQGKHRTSSGWIIPSQPGTPMEDEDGKSKKFIL